MPVGRSRWPAGRSGAGRQRSFSLRLCHSWAVVVPRHVSPRVLQERDLGLLHAGARGVPLYSIHDAETD